MAEVQVTVEEFYGIIGKLYFAFLKEEQKVAQNNEMMAKTVAEREEAERAARALSAQYTEQRESIKRLMDERAALQASLEKMRDEIAVPRSRSRKK